MIFFQLIYGKSNFDKKHGEYHQHIVAMVTMKINAVVCV